LLRERYANSFAEDGLVVELFGVASGLPVLEELVKLAVADALGGMWSGSGGEDGAGGAGAGADVGEHLELKGAGELSHAGGEVGAHQLGGVGEVAPFA
jgi:hypothetical protein